MVGCAGDTPAEPSDSELTLPTQTASESETDAPLDLESMSDEELLAEAERAYQGFLDDVEELRAEGGTDYMSLTQWTTEEFRERFHTTYTDSVPEGTAVDGVQNIIGMELTSQDTWANNEVRVDMCLDNSPLTLVTDSGEVVDTSDGPPTSDGVIVLELSEDTTHLVIAKELESTESSKALCGS